MPTRTRPGWARPRVLAVAALAAVGALAAPEGAAAVEGEVTSNFPIPTFDSRPTDIAAGPDGNLWFIESSGAKKIGRSSPTGAIQEFNVPTSSPTQIAAGPDGAMWFTEFAASGNRIGRVTTGANPTVSEFPVLPTDDAGPGAIAQGFDGNMWFVEQNANAIGRITPGGGVTEFGLPTGNAGLRDISAGPDGNMWFTELGADKIGRITTAATPTITEFPLAAGSDPVGITTGPDGNLWFAENGPDRFGRITPAGNVLPSFPIPVTGSPNEIAAGPDGNIWTSVTNDQIVRTTTDGATAPFPQPADTVAAQIVSGPDGNLWFPGFGNNRIHRMTSGLDPPQFRNPARIEVSPGNVGSANPYPSELAVAGLPDPVTSVRVRLFGISSSRISDMDLLLVGPQGQTALVMGDVATCCPPPVQANVNLADAAGFSLPDPLGLTPLQPGLFKPTNNAPADEAFAAPAPPGPYTTQLSVFNGTNPNGTWRLFADDDTAGASGDLAGGWGLDIGQPAPPAPVQQGQGQQSEQAAAAAQALLAGFGARTGVALSAANLAAGAQLRVKVANSNGFPVTGSLSVQSADRFVVGTAQRRRRRARLRLGTKRVNVPARASRILSFRLPRRLRSRLRRRGRIALRATATVTDPRGTRRTVTKTLRPKLRRKRARRRR